MTSVMRAILRQGMCHEFACLRPTPEVVWEACHLYLSFVSNVVCRFSIRNCSGLRRPRVPRCSRFSDSFGDWTLEVFYAEDM